MHSTLGGAHQPCGELLGIEDLIPGGLRQTPDLLLGKTFLRPAGIDPRRSCIEGIDGGSHRSIHIGRFRLARSTASAAARTLSSHVALLSGGLAVLLVHPLLELLFTELIAVSLRVEGMPRIL
jgi:hypothetical protein